MRRRFSAVFVKAAFVCQNHRSVSCTLVKFSLEALHTNKAGMIMIGTRLAWLWLEQGWHDYDWNKAGMIMIGTRLAWLWLEQGWHDYDWNKAPWQGKMSIFCRAHEQVKLVKVFRTVNLTSRLFWCEIWLNWWIEVNCSVCVYADERLFS
jgi:hypothetical protein